MSVSHALNFANQGQWRMWLEQHHATEQEVWLIIYKKKYHHMGLTLDQAIAEALCFGWIDSTLNTIDEQSYALRFTPRKKVSTWSLSNINRVEKLISEGKMNSAGMLKIAEAKENGEWDAAIQREKVDTIPNDLLLALKKCEGALEAYTALNNSRKKQLLYWLQSAKREETKNRRIQKIIREILEQGKHAETK